jgi:hypothetical protein
LLYFHHYYFTYINTYNNNTGGNYQGRGPEHIQALPASQEAVPGHGGVHLRRGVAGQVRAGAAGRVLRAVGVCGFDGAVRLRVALPGLASSQGTFLLLLLL